MDKDKFLVQKMVEYMALSETVPKNPTLADSMVLYGKAIELFGKIYDEGEKKGLKVLSEIKKLN